MKRNIGALSALVVLGSEYRVSAQGFLSYTPVTPVADVASLDLDFFLLDDLLSKSSFDQAEKIYGHGGNSGSYAVLQLVTPLDSNVNVDLPAGTLVVGSSLNNGGKARGTLMNDLTAGASEIWVTYETSDDQRSFVGCQVGGNPNPKMDGCFVGVGTVTIGASSDAMRLSLPYTYDPTRDNRNARSFQSMSLDSKQNMYDCGDACPFPIYNEFYNYYGRFDYADAFIQAAFNRTRTNDFAHGDMDFSGFTDDSGVTEAVEKGALYLSSWMYVMQFLEEAVASCNSGAGNEVASWDEGVAVYAGSFIRVTGGSEGNMLLTMADQRCRNFGTCADGSSGLANANMEILREFEEGQTNLVNKECEAAAATKDRIINWMTVPMVQGVLRFAELLSHSEWLGFQRAHASGAVYAAALLPRLYACDQQDADAVYASLATGKLDQLVDFPTVKDALERNYDCMGITCAEVGGLVDRNTGQYLSGAEPCGAVDQAMEPNQNSTMIVDEQQVDEGQGTDDQVSAAAVEGNLTDSTATAEHSCPPCGGKIVSLARGNSKCGELVADQFDSIPASCACACFVDSEYTFCARSDRMYEGDGFLVGPCDMREASMAVNGTLTKNATDVVFANEGDPDTNLEDPQPDVQVNEPGTTATEGGGGPSGYSGVKQELTSSAYIQALSITRQVFPVALAVVLGTAI